MTEAIPTVTIPDLIAPGDIRITVAVPFNDAVTVVTDEGMLRGAPVTVVMGNTDDAAPL